MAISLSKRKPKPSKRTAEAQESNPKSCNFHDSFLLKCLSRIPLACLLFILLFIWSSSTTIISGNIVHVCVSSRKLNNLYCLSAGAQPNFDIAIPVLNNTYPIDGSTSQPGESPPTHLEFNISNTTDSYIVNVEEKESVKDNIPAPLTEERANSGDHPYRVEMDDYALKLVQEHIRVQRSWKSKSSANHASCEGRGIFVYDLPSKFNRDLLGQCGDMIPWMNICNYFENEAMGEPIPKLGKCWYQTHQYSLEPIFHARVLKHPCRVYNEGEAKLFYVPFYGGLDILRWHFKNVSNDVKDALPIELMKWLDKQQSWTKNSGKDHVFVLGKISYDFRRAEDSSWGSRFLGLAQMQIPVKLLIERHPWHVNDVGIPHPTNFHPHSDEDIISWQEKIISSDRKHLVSFAGAARPESKESIRTILIEQCTSAEEGKCRFLDCSRGDCFQPDSVTELFMESEFCLQPPGDSPTRKSVFDSLIAGCIPVIFDPFTAYYQYPWHLPEDHEKFSIFINQVEVRKTEVNVVEKLMKVSAQEREELRRFIVYKLLPGLMYGDSSASFDKFQDAFCITMNNLVERVNRLSSAV